MCAHYCASLIVHTIDLCVVHPDVCYAVNSSTCTLRGICNPPASPPPPSPSAALTKGSKFHRWGHLVLVHLTLLYKTSYPTLTLSYSIKLVINLAFVQENYVIFFVENLCLLSFDSVTINTQQQNDGDFKNISSACHNKNLHKYKKEMNENLLFGPLLVRRQTVPSLIWRLHHPTRMCC